MGLHGQQDKTAWDLTRLVTRPVATLLGAQAILIGCLPLHALATRRLGRVPSAA